MERQESIIAEAPAVIAQWSLRPFFSIIVHQASISNASRFRDILSSLERQSYPHWELIVVPSSYGLTEMFDECGNVRTARTAIDNPADVLAIGMIEARGDFILPLLEGVLLSPTALYHYAQILQTDPHADVLYGDQDRIDMDGQRSSPWFKPLWNDEMFLAQDYISQSCVIRAEALLHLPDLAGRTPYALLIELKDRARIVRVPYVQAHVAVNIPDRNDQPERLRTVQRALGENAKVAPGPFGTLRVEWPLPSPLPLVSIIVPTRDHVKLLRSCITSLLERTTYRPIEVIVVDNGSRDTSTLNYLRQLEAHSEVRVLRYDHPYNYSAINNFAVAHARGEYLCLLNNDTEVIEGEWLTAMMRHAIRPHVGAVGATLLYDDGSIQHAGVVVGIKRAAGHAHRFLPRDQPGYFSYPHVPQYMSAVTAACLVIERRKFDAVGGLDHVHLAIAFNDVDFCLKLRQAGWCNIYTPQAVLVHHESKSRGRDVSPRHLERYRRELAVFQQRWGTISYTDPLHHPHLDPESEDFTIKIP